MHRKLLINSAQLPLWNLGDEGVEIYGIFWGHKDTYLEVFDSSNQHTLGSGMKYKLFVQPFKTFATQIQAATGSSFGEQKFGSAQRLGPDKYVGVGYDAAGAPIPGAYLWLSGEGAPGFIGIPGLYDPSWTLGTQFWTAGGKDGEAHIWIEYDDAIDIAGVDYGTANPTYDKDWFWSAVDPTCKADVRLQIDTYSVDHSLVPDEFDWLVTSSDPMQMWGVLEEGNW